MIGTLLVCATLLAVDGDTIKCNGVSMRDMGNGRPFVSGYDTPEIFNPKCQEELELGRAAKARMSELLATPGVRVWDSGQRDKSRSRRPLVWVRLPSGQTIGSVLMREGLARKWTPKSKANWC